MRTLGLETSCDETAAAVVLDGRVIQSSVVASQADLHRRFGGVVPELASRKHVERLLPVLDEALDQAAATLRDLDAVAVTCGPGLVGALTVGVAAAKSLALSLDVPLVGVNHLEGHIYAAFLTVPELRPPALALIVSGAHTDLIAIADHGRYQVLGRTRDDAAGEAFDKIARAMGLGYPGGPEIDRLAGTGDPHAVPLPLPMADDTLEFSFSGVKTAALRALHTGAGRNGQFRADLAASLQRVVVEVLVRKTIRAAEQFPAAPILVVGGVAANTALRTEMARACAAARRQLVVPPVALCTDNAAMIAAAGYYRLMRGQRADLSLGAVGDLPLA
jgi:N6-L-threonylcarbamoyladenine synthase